MHVIDFELLLWLFIPQALHNQTSPNFSIPSKSGGAFWFLNN
jgi:hypothetical protein